jgi:trk system potassium uptake protein TrkA
MNIIIVGCGRVGAEIAYGLYRKGHKITVVDQDSAAFRNLPEDFRGLTMRGDVLTQEVLMRAGIQNADALAAVTPSDSVNTVLGHIARVVFKVPNVVVRNYDPRKRALHDAFGLHVISPVSMGALRIEEILSREPLSTVIPSGDGAVEIYQFCVPQAWHGSVLRDLVPLEQCRPVSLTRDGRSSLPVPDDTIQSGDLLQLSTTREAAKALRERLNQLQEN